jgi:hypothetical protein
MDDKEIDNPVARRAAFAAIEDASPAASASKAPPPASWEKPNRTRSSESSGEKCADFCLGVRGVVRISIEKAFALRASENGRALCV